MKLYKDYVEMYQKAVECLNRNKSELPQFKKFLEVSFRMLFLEAVCVRVCVCVCRAFCSYMVSL